MKAGPANAGTLATDEMLIRSEDTCHDREET